MCDKFTSLFLINEQTKFYLPWKKNKRDSWSCKFFLIVFQKQNIENDPIGDDNSDKVSMFKIIDVHYLAYVNSIFTDGGH